MVASWVLLQPSKPEPRLVSESVAWLVARLARLLVRKQLWRLPTRPAT